MRAKRVHKYFHGGEVCLSKIRYLRMLYTIYREYLGTLLVVLDDEAKDSKIRIQGCQSRGACIQTDS
jgi:hypothetical protein